MPGLQNFSLSDNFINIINSLDTKLFLHPNYNIIEVKIQFLFPRYISKLRNIFNHKLFIIHIFG